MELIFYHQHNTIVKPQTEVVDIHHIYNNMPNKLRLSCAKLRPPSLLSLLLLVNSEICKCEKRSTSTEANKEKLFQGSSVSEIV